MKYHIQDRVQIGRYEHLGSLQGRVGVVVSFANTEDGAGCYQRCNVVLNSGERVPLLDSRVLKKVETK